MTMVQVINKPTLSTLFGSALGTGVGHGLSNELERMAAFRAQDMANRRYSQGLQQLPGVTPQVANFLAALNPEERKYALQNIGSLIELGNQPQQEQFSGLQNVPQYAEQQEQPQLSPQQESQLRLLLSPDVAQQNLQKLSSTLGKHPLEVLDFIEQNPHLGNALQLVQELIPHKPAEQEQQRAAEPGNQAVVKAPLKSDEISDRAQKIQDIFTSPQEKRERQKLALKERQIAQQERAARYKETKEDRKEILNKYKTAKDALRDLNRMQELEDTGNLDTPGYVEFLKRSGLDIPALMNPESEEFQKIAANFMRDAKTYFGGRVSNYEIEQFLKTIPSLSQSPEGRKRVIANLKQINNGAVEYYKALKQVLAENEGLPPYDLLEQVEDKVDKKQETLAQKFKEDLSRPVPKGQNKYITALQSSAPAAPSALGSAVVGGLSGARLGSAFGPYGTAAGAAGGALLGPKVIGAISKFLG